MIIGKEYLIYLEKIANEQRKIYPDAADYGILVTHGDGVYTRISEAVNCLKETYKFKTSKWEGFRGSNGVNIKIFIPFEFDEGYYVGAEVVISYNIDKVRKKNFFSIDITNKSMKESPFKEV